MNFHVADKWIFLSLFVLCRGIQIIEIGITCSMVLLQRSVVIVTCLAIGFIVNWKLAMVLSFLLPFLMMFIYILVKVKKKEGFP